jgi:hypothetical protein
MPHLWPKEVSGQHILHLFNTKMSHQTTAMRLLQQQKTNGASWNTQLGLVGFYRRFVRDFSTIATPLHGLTKNGVPFQWGPAQQQAFEALKSKLTQAPLLQLPNFEKTFELGCGRTARIIPAQVRY